MSSQVRDETFYSQLFEDTPIAIFVIDASHNVIIWNKACVKLSGLKASCVLNTTNHRNVFSIQEKQALADLVLDSSEDSISDSSHMHSISKLLPNGCHIEGWFDFNGKRKFILFDAAAILNEDGENIAAIETIQDITDLMKDKEEIDDNNTRLRKTIDEISFLIMQVVKMRDFSVRYENPNLKRCYEFMQCGKEECACHSKNNDNLRCWQVSGTFCKGKVQGLFAEKFQNCSICPYFKEVTKDSLDLLCEQFNNMMHILETEHCELENTYNDLKFTQAHMLQTEKLASIGQLAAGIAHEINTPAGFAMSNISTLRKYITKLTEFTKIQFSLIGDNVNASILKEIADCKQNMKIDYVMEDMDSLIAETLDGLERIKYIVQNIKNFSQVDKLGHSLSDINTGVESAISIAWNDLKDKATLDKEYGVIPLTFCNIAQLNQVFLSLLINAAQAIDQKGEVKVKTWSDSHNIYISISDTGEGIAEENLNRIFEPFFTTKEIGKGTGLGLSIAYDIIIKHNGLIGVESEVHKGTTFTITLPIINS